MLFFGVFRGNQYHHLIRRQILHETVFLSQISQISTMVLLYINTSIFRSLFFRNISMKYIDLKCGHKNLINGFIRPLILYLSVAVIFSNSTSGKLSIPEETIESNSDSKYAIELYFHSNLIIIIM